MVELGVLPACGCMAAGAIGPELSLVDVLNLVTAVTIRRHTLIDLADMAGLANDFLMLVLEGEFRLVVIKGLGGPPARFGMAGFA